jgi:RNA polymerase sigma-70 factor (ECF subfamily)
MTGPLDFEALVHLHYAALYRFALSLTCKESDACDLTQQTFYIWATKGHQLRDASKVKAWLFTTLHREFLQMQRQHTRFPEQELDEVIDELPPVDPELIRQLDGRAVVALLAQVDAVFRAPLALFYLDDCPYNEIATTLGVPLGTVKSRIARGLAQLQVLLAKVAPLAGAGKRTLS